MPQQEKNASCKDHSVPKKVWWADTPPLVRQDATLSDHQNKENIPPHDEKAYPQRHKPKEKGHDANVVQH
jgi:hypothetical protein